MSEILERLYGVAADPIPYLRSWKAVGRKIIGWVCTYVPEELVHAAGMLPARVFGDQTPLSLADHRLPPFMCTYVKEILESGLRGDYDFLDGIVFAYMCDPIKDLSDIWARNVRPMPRENVVVPVKMNTAATRDYFVGELERFRARVEAIAGAPITPAALRASIDVYNRHRAAFRRLYALRAERPEVVRVADIWAILRSSMVMPKEEHTALLEPLVDELAGVTRHDGKGRGPRLFVTGNLCDHPPLLGLIEECGGVVVSDDLCTGTRYFDGPGIDPDAPNPLASIADFYLNKPACAVKCNYQIADRGEFIAARARATGADGVIFLLVKFCSPQNFEYPLARDVLRREGIPHILLEYEWNERGSGQMQTRLSAFIETL